MKTEDNDRSIAYMAIVCAVLVVAFLLTWWHMRPPPDPATNVTFANVGPISLQSRDFTLRASFALQSKPEDGDEVIKHRTALLNFLQATLENADPKILSSTDGKKYAELQKQLTETVNAKYPKIKIEQVWITDFVTSSD